MPAAAFAGFPKETIRFYEDLEQDNSKAFWEAHKAIYERACRAPMLALLADLEADFGAGRMFRPYRDVRFSADKSPYKVTCSAMIGRGGYVQISADGLYVGGGNNGFEGAALGVYREAVASDRAGADLAAIIAKLKRAGYEIGGEALKTAPRGYPADHPRIELLRYKGLHAGRNYPADAALTSKAILTQVRKTLRDVWPLVEWLEAHVPHVPRERP